MCACLVVQVCDSVLNIGPIANLTLGEPAFLSVSEQWYFLETDSSIKLPLTLLPSPSFHL